MTHGLKTNVFRGRSRVTRKPVRPGSLPVVPRDAYRRGGLIAEGGMGRIVGADDLRLGRRVAIKELLSEDAWLRRRFIREALITSRLQHPSIVPVYEAGQWPDGAAFYAMKLVEGRTLADLLDDAKGLDARLVLLRHLSVSAEAIAYAHDKSIIHRDLKPENVLVGPFGETVIIDWGLVKDLDDEEDAREEAEKRPNSDLTRAYSSVRDGKLTTAGAIVGTPEYMSPEQALGEPVDQRTDVYALGTMLYELLTGAQPFTGESAGEILAKLTSQTPRPPESLCKEVPRELAAIASKAMARAPEDRYPSAKEFAEELRRFEAGQIVRAHRYGKRERFVRFIRRNAQLLAVLSVATLVLILFTGLAVNRVIAERNRATEERNRATAAERQAVAWSDSLVLQSARNELARDPNKALAWLKELSPSFDAWAEVRLIAAEARSRGISLALRGHEGPVSEGRFSPDGRWVVTAADDRTARVWDTTSWESQVLEGHEGEVWKVRFSPDGSRVATFGAGPKVLVWEVGSWKPLATFTGHREPVWEGAWAQGGRSLLVASRGEGYVLHDVETGQSHTLTRSSRRHIGLAVSADGRAIAYPDDDQLVVRTLGLGDPAPALADPEAAVALPGDFSADLYAMALAPDGERVAAGFKDGELRLWTLAHPEQQSRSLGTHDGGTRSVDFTRDGAYVLSSGADGAVRKTSVNTRKEYTIGQLDTSIARPFSFDGQRIAVAAADGLIHTWDLETRKHRAYYGLDNNPISVNLAPQGAGIIATDFEGGVRVWTELAPDGDFLLRGPKRARWSAIAPNRELVAFVDRRGRARVYALADGRDWSVGRQRVRELKRGRWSPGSTHLALWTRGGELALLDAREGAKAERRVDVGQLTALSWQGDEAVITASQDGRLTRWPVDAAPQLLHEQDAPLTAVITDPEGAWTAAADADGRVLLLREGEAPTVLSAHEGHVLTLAVSPDGQRLATAGSDHKIHVWDLRAQTRLHSFTVQTDNVGLVFSATGARLAGWEPRWIWVWNLETGEGVELKGHTAAINAVVFSDGETHLATASADHSARLWNLSVGSSRVLPGTAEVYDVRFVKRDRALLTTGADGNVRRWADDLPREPRYLRAWINDATDERIDSPGIGGAAEPSTPTATP